MSDAARPFATLREPTLEEASRWHKARKSPVLARMKVLVDFLIEDECVRVVKRTDSGAELLLDTGGGTTLRITFRDGEIDLRVGPFLIEAGKETISHAAYVDEISSLIEVLQIGSGFYVYSDELLGFEPTGACPGCDLEVFEWQDTCEICTAKLHEPLPGEDEHDGRSKRVVAVLLRRNMIELTSPRSRRNVERTVSHFYAHGSAHPDVLLGIFMDMADIAEVYCDEVELRRVLRRIR